MGFGVKPSFIVSVNVPRPLLSFPAAPNVTMVPAVGPGRVDAGNAAIERKRAGCAAGREREPAEHGGRLVSSPSVQCNDVAPCHPGEGQSRSGLLLDGAGHNEIIRGQVHDAAKCALGIEREAEFEKVGDAANRYWAARTSLAIPSPMAPAARVSNAMVPVSARSPN